MRSSRLLALVLFALSVVPTAGAREPHEYLWQCVAIGREDSRHRCYERLLLERIERSGDPARELPRIDRDVAATGGELLGACHALMHEVGRRYGREHRVTLATLRRYIPRSNDPTCSAGFGMGLVMYLGPELVRTGGRGALRECHALPTRFRAYTCIHGLGHALMRGLHGDLKPTVHACRGLGPHGIDCAQGAFHDYWISLRGADGTERPRGAIASPRTICDGRLTFVRPCWYRYFIEQRFGPALETAADLRRACRGLRPLQRAGCIAGAALALGADPFVQTGVCARLSRPSSADAAACLRGVAVQALAGRPERQLALMRRCGEFGRQASACYSWFGRTLALVTDGAFTQRCGELTGAASRRACRSGARRVGDPLVSFA
jgi:hypothetical protein